VATAACIQLIKKLSNKKFTVMRSQN